MIDIHKKVRFVPYWCKGGNDTPEGKRSKTVTGTVIYVDRAHKKFSVKYSCGGYEGIETFKLSDVGKDVHIVGGGKHGR